MNKDTILLLYDKFEDKPNITLEQKRDIINNLLKKFTKIRQYNLAKMLRGEIKKSPNLYRKAYNDLAILRKQYANIVFTYLMTEDAVKKRLYTYFYEISDVDEEKLIAIVNMLFNNLSKYEMDNLTSYLKDKRNLLENEKKQAQRTIENLKKNYRYYLKNNHLPALRKPLYNRFPNIEGVSEEEKRKVIDDLVKKNEGRKMRLTRYFNGETRKEELKQIYSDLACLQECYKNHYNIPRNQGKILSLYERFPGEPTYIKMFIIDLLVLSLSKQEQDILSTYLSKEYRVKSDSSKKALKVINKLTDKYKNLKLSEKKMSLLESALSLIEYQFKTIGLTEKDLTLKKQDILKKVITLNNFEIEKIIAGYITLAYHELKVLKQEEKYIVRT